MSASCHSPGVRREALRPRYEGQDSAMYRAQGAQGNFSDFRTSDVNDPLHDYSVYPRRKHRPSHIPGYSSSRSQREGSSLCSGSSAPRPGSSFELIPVDTKRPREHRSKPRNESARVLKGWVETPTHLLARTPEPLEPVRSPVPQSVRDKTVRFDDDVYLDAVLPNRFPGTVRDQRDTLRRQFENQPVRAPGNGYVTGEFEHRGGHQKVLPKRSRASERQRNYVPAAPVIPRLPTPELDSTSDYELGLAKYDFCACCSSDDRHEDSGKRWKRGKAKMDKQVDHARAYISRVTMNERLIAEA
ncbi:hypothetical protein F4859DRAFT_332881 [Xylaria cf. heliscus]|nr:hypothetical protein F4859DRAFT_332881 [Xylaria cf. heliscus]